MSYGLNAVLSLSIGLGVLVGWARFRKTGPAFFPFLLLLTVGLVNEGTSILLISHGHSNMVNFNLFELLESFLLTWQFLRWGLFASRRSYFLLQGLFALAWTAENFIRCFQAYSSYFIIAHSFILVMMSISMINRTAVKAPTSLLKQPVFLICMGLVIYYDYAVLVEAFWIFGLNHSRSFRVAVYGILTCINLVTNLIFAFAFLWIPMRPQYILRS